MYECPQSMVWNKNRNKYNPWKPLFYKQINGMILYCISVYFWDNVDNKSKICFILNTSVGQADEFIHASMQVNNNYLSYSNRYK